MLALCLFVILVFFLHAPLAYADQGGFSLRNPYVTIYESKQQAIIAWNGTQEVLILSTDVSSSNETEVLEIMPLPSNPLISKGEKQSFLKIQELVNTYLNLTTFPTQWTYLESLGGIQSNPTITITFQEIIGVHFLTVVRAEEANDLIQWLVDFLEAEGYSKELPSSLEGLLSHYTQDEINFFVINIIRTNETSKTVEPLIFQFNSSTLYYPMRISTLFSGDSDISLFTITNNPLVEYSMKNAGFVRKALFQIKHETIAEISLNITQLFSNNPYLSYFRYGVSLKMVNADISAVSNGGITLEYLPSPNVSPLSLSFLSLGIGSLFLLFFAYKTGQFLRKASVARWLDRAFASVGLIGIFLILVGCFLPWGLVGYGENGEVLLPVFGLNGMVVLFLLVTLPFIFLSTYYILAKRKLEATSWTLTTGGLFMIIFMLTLSAYYLYTVNIGVLTIIVGSSLLLFAGLFPLLRAKLMSGNKL